MAWRNKVLSWLNSDSGRKFSYITANVCCFGSICAHLLPQTVFINEYAKIIHLYKNGFAVDIPNNVLARFEKTLDILEVKEEDRYLYKPFSVLGFDVCAIGTSYTKFGVRIGIPKNFFYNKLEDVDRNIKIQDESVQWELDEAQLLQKSMVLQENAQMYAIAREIKFAETPKLIIDTVLSVLCIGGFYGLSRTFNERLNFAKAPRHIRVIMYCLVGALSYGTYIFCKDFSQVFYEKEVDEKLKKIPIFAEGGKEFYSKIIGRNIALRALMGKEGPHAFTSLGNDNYLFRYRHVPNVQRKSYFEEQ